MCLRYTPSDPISLLTSSTVLGLTYFMAVTALVTLGSIWYPSLETSLPKNDSSSLNSLHVAAFNFTSLFFKRWSTLLRCSMCPENDSENTIISSNQGINISSRSSLKPFSVNRWKFAGAFKAGSGWLCLPMNPWWYASPSWKTLSHEFPPKQPKAFFYTRNRMSVGHFLLV